MVQKPVSGHEKLQLLIGFVGDTIINNGSQRRVLFINKTQNFGSGVMHYLDSLFDLRRRTGDG